MRCGPHASVRATSRPASACSDNQPPRTGAPRSPAQLSGPPTKYSLGVPERIAGDLGAPDSWRLTPLGGRALLRGGADFDVVAADGGAVGLDLDAHAVEG